MTEAEHCGITAQQERSSAKATPSPTSKEHSKESENALSHESKGTHPCCGESEAGGHTEERHFVLLFFFFFFFIFERRPVGIDVVTKSGGERQEKRRLKKKKKKKKKKTEERADKIERERHTERE